MAKDLFISYSRRDKTFVQSLHQDLVQAGHDVWVDWENIPLTSEWFEEIKSGIEKADSLVFVISPDSVKSEVCGQELAHGLKNNKRLIPILHRELEDEDKAKLHAALSSHNWIFFRPEDDYQKSLHSLIGAIKTDLEYTRSHTRLLTRAIEWDSKGRDKSFLLRGSDLLDAEEWQVEAQADTEKEPQITDLHKHYIDASRSMENARRRSQMFFITVSAALIVTLVALGVAYWQYTIAQFERGRAQQLSMAANSQVAMSNSNRDLAIALALTASENGDDISEIERALSVAAYSPGTRMRLSGHSAPVTAVALSSDNTWAASGADDGKVRVWDIAGGSVHLELDARESSLEDVAFSSDNRYIAAASADGLIRIWDVETGERIHQLVGHEGIVGTIAFTQDNRYLLSGGADRTIRRWNLKNGRQVMVYERLKGSVMSLAIHPDGDHFLSIALETEPTLWRIDNEEPVRRYTEQMLDEINLDEGAAQFVNGGTQVLSSAGINLHLWDVETGDTIYILSGHGSYVNSIAISPDSLYAVSTAKRENSLRMWDLSTGVEIDRFEGHRGVLADIAIDSEMGRYVLTASADHTVRVWDLAHGAIIRRYTDSEDSIYGVDVSPDGRFIIAAGVDPVIRMWDIRSGEEIAEFEGHSDTVWSLDFSPDGRRILSGGADNTVKLWDVESRSLVSDYDDIHNDVVTVVTFSPDGNYALTGSNDRTIRLLDLEEGVVIRVFDEDDGQLRSLAFHPNGLQFAAGAGTARLIDLETGRTVQRYRGHRDRVNSIDFNSDGSRIVTGSGDASLIVWDTATGEIANIMEGHTGQVRSSYFSLNDHYVLSSSADATLRLWDIRSGLEVRQYQGHREWINQAVFTPDGQFAVSGSWDNTLLLWHMHDRPGLIEWVRNNRFVRDLTCSEARIYMVVASSECAVEVALEQE